MRDMMGVAGGQGLRPRVMGVIERVEFSGRGCVGIVWSRCSPNTTTTAMFMSPWLINLDLLPPLLTPQPVFLVNGTAFEQPRFGVHYKSIHARPIKKCSVVITFSRMRTRKKHTRIHKHKYSDNIYLSIYLSIYQDEKVIGQIEIFIHFFACYQLVST